MKALTGLILLALAGSGFCRVGGRLSVILRSSGSCQGSQISLRDVADLEGPEELLARVKTAVVGASPSWGRTRQLQADQVRLYLLRAGLKPDEFELTGSREVLVSRESRQISPDEILASIQCAATEQSPEQDVELEFVSAQSPVSLPLGEWDLQVSRLTYYASNAACTVTFHVAGVPVKTARYTLKAVHFGEALVATRDLDKGTILAADDLIPQRVKLTPGRRFLLSGDEYVGSQVVSRIAAGEPVPGRSIALPILVQKGSQVRLRARVGGCEVTCAAIAMQDGRAGQIIRLKADHTEKPLTGRVTGPQQADALLLEGGN